jgi:hypothetical protein
MGFPMHIGVFNQHSQECFHELAAGDDAQVIHRWDIEVLGVNK